MAVLGLGRFGRAVALELMDSGVEVLGVDADERAVQDLNGRLTHVVRADATDEEALRQLSVHEMERVVVAIGGDLADSILTVSLMIRFGIDHLWAKANDERHEEILRQLGVENLIHPERDMGRRVAHLVSNSVQDFVAVENGFAMVRAAAPRRFYGRDLRGLGLAGEAGVRVAAMRAGGSWRYPAGHEVVGPEDTLLPIGSTREVESFLAEG
ncbi:potassium channel family protein [Micrococcus flavus]|uniref:Trk system potassium uptake protein TrkA n=1 Tax=Micrococcus flavus TaxID=384602 RepID=A0A7W7P9C3_9MICC|nr:TrkA family potassium uptake protein [Micrococcus flavus]MBB4882381.1 trk system potassium uptake protein TrkA [Micrococcus flavus]GGK49100.1 potassium transporter Trk [Micrococcus flavus]